METNFHGGGFGKITILINNKYLAYFNTLKFSSTLI